MLFNWERFYGDFEGTILRVHVSWFTRVRLWDRKESIMGLVENELVYFSGCCAEPEGDHKYCRRNELLHCGCRELAPAL